MFIDSDIRLLYAVIYSTVIYAIEGQRHCLDYCTGGRSSSSDGDGIATLYSDNEALHQKSE